MTSALSLLDDATVSAMVAELRRRGEVLPDVAGLEEARAQDVLWERWRADVPAFFAEAMVTVDPRRASGERDVRFALWPWQVGFLARLEDRYQGGSMSMVVEKSRDVGMTYVVCGWMLHKCLFERGFVGMVGSAKAELADKKGNPNSIVEKFRSMLRSMPAWAVARAMPADWEKTCVPQNMVRFPLTGSVLTAEIGRNMGRSGRCSMFFVDEYAFFLAGEDSLSAVMGCTDRVLVASTHQGVETQFFRLCENEAWERVTVPAAANPLHTPEWLERKKAELGAVKYAEEFGVDPVRSGGGSVVPYEAALAACGLSQGGRRAAVWDSPKGRKGAPREKPRPVVGFDVGGENGGESHAIAVRLGSDVPFVSAFAAPTVAEAARRALRTAKRLADGHGACCIVYDCQSQDGKRAGQALTEGAARLPGVSVAAFVGSAPPKRRSERRRCRNRRAEVWTQMAERCVKSMEALKGLEGRPEHECLLLPQDAGLARECSRPLLVEREGRLLVEAKADMKKRGAQSPHRADAVAMTLAVPWDGPPAAKRKPGRPGGASCR